MNGWVDLRDLRYFLACLDEGNVTRAARRIHAAQPTLSHALRRLEDEAGVRLVERRPRQGLRPTAAGELLAARARRALEALAGFSDDLAGLAGLERGSLRIAAIQSLATTLLPPSLSAYLRRHPGIATTVNVTPTSEVVTAVRDGRANLGFVAGPSPPLPPGVKAEHLFREEFVAVVASSDPLARRRAIPLGELRSRALVLVASTSPTGAIIQAACAEAGFSPDVRLTIDSGEVAREMVRSGVGATILPERYLPGRATGLRAVRLTHPTPTREVRALLPASGLDAAASAFLDHVRHQVVSRRRGLPASPGTRPAPRPRRPGHAPSG